MLLAAKTTASEKHSSWLWCFSSINTTGGQTLYWFVINALIQTLLVVLTAVGRQAYCQSTTNEDE